MTQDVIYLRLVAILSELPVIGKNQKNEQQGFMFRGHDDILAALNPLLAKHGVVVVPDVLERETSQRTTSKGGVMYEVNLHVRYTFYAEDGSSVSASTWGEGTDTGDKATNKAMTMAFKNVLNQTFAISSAEFKDADAETPEKTRGRNKPATEKKITKGTATQIGAETLILNEKFPEHPGENRTWEDEGRAWIKDKFQKDSTKDLSEAEAVQLLTWLEDTHRDLEANKDVPF